jgi:ABC-type Na+ efflux pump permease subunit
MLYKIWMSIVKEFLLLKRDLGGLIILFIMPLILVITVTIIQDSTFKTVSDNKIQILLVDNDKGSVSKTVFDNLQKNNAFDVVTQIDNQPITEEVAKENVYKGKFKLAIVIPKDLSVDLQAKVDQNVQNIVSKMGFTDSIVEPKTSKVLQQKEVKLYFDPAVQMSFKTSVMNAIDKMISQIETKSIYTTFQNQLGEENAQFEQKSFITFKEIIPRINNKEVLPNSVQHNVPAWTLFAIFFYCDSIVHQYCKRKITRNICAFINQSDFEFNYHHRKNHYVFNDMYDSVLYDGCGGDFPFPSYWLAILKC